MKWIATDTLQGCWSSAQGPINMWFCLLFQTEWGQRKWWSFTRIAGVEPFMFECRLRIGVDLKRNKVHNRSATKRRRSSGHNKGLEVRGNGGRQTVPYHIHFVHDNRHARGVVLRASHHRVVALPWIPFFRWLNKLKLHQLDVASAETCIPTRSGPVIRMEDRTGYSIDQMLAPPLPSIVGSRFIRKFGFVSCSLGY